MVSRAWNMLLWHIVEKVSSSAGKNRAKGLWHAAAQIQQYAVPNVAMLSKWQQESTAPRTARELFCAKPKFEHVLILWHKRKSSRWRLVSWQDMPRFPRRLAIWLDHEQNVLSSTTTHGVKTFDTRISPRQLDTHQWIDCVICAVEAPAERAFETEANTSVDVCVSVWRLRATNLQHFVVRLKRKLEIRPCGCGHPSWHPPILWWQGHARSAMLKNIVMASL